MKKKPLIGLTIDGQNPKKDEYANKYSEFYWYAQRSACINAIIQSGGIPIMLPHDQILIADYVQLIDGLIISGGGHDTPAEYFNEKPHPKMRLKEERSSFEKKIFLDFLKTNKPILGICGGMQLMAALCGGKIYQYLPENGDFQEHTQNTSPNQVFHTITCVKESQLNNILQPEKEAIWVNSVHQQGVKHAGSFTPSAHAEDGLIEAFEDKKHLFCIGVQWHPEYLITEYDKRLFSNFISNA